MERLIRLPEVLRVVGFKKSSVYNLIATGDFPRPIKIGTRAAAWPESVIEKWVQDKIADAVRKEVSQQMK